MPRVTKAMAAKAKARGASVKKKVVLPKPKPKPKPAPPPPPPMTDNKFDFSAIEKQNENVSALVAAMMDQLNSQRAESGKLIESMLSDKPCRLKVHRNMNRESPTYLLIEYIDVIPVEYSRKLDS